MFVFRNNTVERFFPKDYAFSGYDDISYVPVSYTHLDVYKRQCKGSSSRIEMLCQKNSNL